MRYILDDLGYVEACSSGNPITCQNKSCTEYTGTIPDGYTSIEEWVLEANVGAYYIVDGNLTYDADKDAEIEAEKEKCGAEYDLTEYKASAVSTIARSKCVEKNKRVVLSFVGTITASKNTETVLFQLPNEITPKTIRDFNVIATTSSAVVVGYAYIRSTGNVCVRFPTSAISTSYDTRINGTYDLD